LLVAPVSGASAKLHCEMFVRRDIGQLTQRYAQEAFVSNQLALSRLALDGRAQLIGDTTIPV
jgi:hypothetical protein